METYFDTQTMAVNYAVESVSKKFQIKDEDIENSKFFEGWVGYGNYRQDSIPIYQNDKLQRKMLHICLYRMESGRYELNFYIN